MLPARYKDSVRAITPGTPLFLYNVTRHELHGIFEVKKTYVYLNKIVFVIEFFFICSDLTMCNFIHESGLQMQATSFGTYDTNPLPFLAQSDNDKFPAQVCFGVFLVDKLFILFIVNLVLFNFLQIKPKKKTLISKLTQIMRLASF